MNWLYFISTSCLLVNSVLSEDLKNTNPVSYERKSGISTGGSTADGQSVYDVLKRIKANRFVEMIDKTDLKSTLESPGGFTVFAPSDDFLETVPGEVMSYLMNNKEVLTKVVQYHIAEGKYLTFDTANTNVKVPTLLSGHDIWLNKYGKIVTANGHPLEETDQIATNGVVQGMDGFFLPLPDGKSDKLLNSASIFEQFYTLVKKSGLLEEYFSGEEPYTVFAPVNTAFYRMSPNSFRWLSNNLEAMKDLVLQHTVKGIYYIACLEGDINELKTVAGTTLKLDSEQGRRYFVNNAEIGIPDITTFNGVIHAIDDVIIPPSNEIQRKSMISPKPRPTIRPGPSWIPSRRPYLTPPTPRYQGPYGGFRPTPPRPFSDRPTRPGTGVQPNVIIPRRPTPRPAPRPAPVTPDRGTPYDGFGPVRGIDARTFVSADEAHSLAIDQMVIQARKAGAI